MKVHHRFFCFVFLGVLILSACDLQPKIASIPDSIGAFISDRYPALLADPNSQPEIYNSAVTDYGVYASPELYGSGNIDDYVMYASVDDYVLAPVESTVVEEVVSDNDIVPNDLVVPDDDVQDDEEDDDIVESEPELDYLVVPTYGGFFEDAPVVEKIEVPESGQPKVKEIKEKVDSDMVIVARGDTLYSLAKKYNTSVDELAKINSLKEPYTLSIGQKLKIRGAVVEQPKIENVISKERVAQIKAEQAIQQKVSDTAVVNEVKPNTVKRVDLQEIVVNPGDTLYSISRKYQIPVNDLAVMNKLSSPFTLSVGQKLKVPKLDDVEIRSVKQIKEIKSDTVVKKSTKSVVKSDKAKITPAKSSVNVKVEKKIDKKSEKKAEKKIDSKKDKGVKVNSKHSQANKSEKPAVAKKTPEKTVQKTKISSNPKQQLPKITARSSSKFSWPVRGKILSQYGAKNKGLFNDGINISAAQGTTVKAAENGVVAYAGNEVKGMGNLIIIQHSDGWMTVYAHLGSMVVKRGTKVSVGQQIGKIGKTGKVDKPQLHFEIRKGTKAYNPISYLKK